MEKINRINKVRREIIRKEYDSQIMAHSLKNDFSFEWKIENLSYCWLKKGEPIASPTFEVGPFPTTEWSLLLYPGGIISEKHVGVYLRREKDNFGTKIVVVSFQFSFLNENGLFLETKYGTNRGFAAESVSGIGEFITQDKIFGSEREKFLPHDILTVQCSMWMKNDLLINQNPNASVQTIFKLNRRSFFWTMNGFSTLRAGQRNQFVILNKSKKILMVFYLVSNFKREINLEIGSLDERLKSFSFEISVLDIEHKKIDFGRHTFFFGDIKARNKLLISGEQLMQNADRFLPNDVLSLVCDYVFTTGTILHICEKKNFGITSSNNTREITKVPNMSQSELHQTQALVHDLKSMYTEAILYDIELRTSTQTFRAHKSILSARSAVFSKMFSSDMREKNSGHVDIIDLEDDTVHQMLMYIYTDVLEDMQFESACKLYSAADKYAIFPLKEKCSYFLKENVGPTNVCELVSLAYRHEDEALKSTMENYILDNSKEVFGTLEWKNFMATNLQLAADIMYKKVYPN